MATPEIVLGASLLTMFVSIGGAPFFPLSAFTILIAHIMFNISYVVVTVRARLTGFPRHLEEAAIDLGANEWPTFWKVTFPLILPGIVAAGLLAFSLSIDDFVITNFTAGKTQTFPMFIYAKNRIGIPVQVNVIGTIIFLIAVGTVGVTTLARIRADARARKLSLARRDPPRDPTVESRALRARATRGPPWSTPPRPAPRPAPRSPPSTSSLPSGAGSRTSSWTAAKARGSSRPTASGTSTTAPGSASRTPATPTRVSRRRWRPRR